MYIPTDAEIDSWVAKGQLAAIGGSKPVTVSDMALALKDFLATDNYTKNHRGEVAKRNGARNPWESQVDLHIAQDFHFMVGKQKQTIQLTFDVLNFANMLNNSWGKSYVTKYNVPVINFAGFRPDPSDATKPNYSMPVFQYNPYGFPTKQTYTESDFFSRWRGQVGIRYIF
jgi:hypothetical protein